MKHTINRGDVFYVKDRELHHLNYVHEVLK